MTIDKVFIEYKKIADTVLSEWESEINKTNLLGDGYFSQILKEQYPYYESAILIQDVLDRIKKDFEQHNQNIEFLRNFLSQNLSLMQTEPLCLVQADHAWYLNIWHRRYSSRDTTIYSKKQFSSQKKSYEFVWLYQDSVYGINGLYTQIEQKLFVLEHADKEHRKFEKIKNKASRKKTDELKFERTRIPEEVRIAVWRRDQGKCARCGSREYLEYDHIVPVSKGGGNTERNIELLCQSCNRAKGNRIE